MPPYPQHRAPLQALDGHSLHVPAQSSLPTSLPLVSNPASASLREDVSSDLVDEQPEVLSPYTQLQRQQQQFQKWDEAQMWHLLHSEYGIRWESKKKPGNSSADTSASGQPHSAGESGHASAATGPRTPVSCVIPPDQVRSWQCWSQWWRLPACACVCSRFGMRLLFADCCNLWQFHLCRRYG